MNPYGQGEWQQQPGAATPSMYGALPSMPASGAPSAMQADVVTYQLIDFKTTILNSTVLDPQQCTIYQVVTEATAPAYTILRDNDARTVAMVEWQPHAMVEIRRVAAKQRARDWLRLSSDQGRRLMEVRGVQYAWAPMDGFICLYKVNTSAPKVLARIARVPGKVTLDLTRDAMQVGLLEPALVATVFLSCGHNID